MYLVDAIGVGVAVPADMLPVDGETEKEDGRLFVRLFCL